MGQGWPSFMTNIVGAALGAGHERVHAGWQAGLPATLSRAPLKPAAGKQLQAPCTWQLLGAHQAPHPTCVSMEPHTSMPLSFASICTHFSPSHFSNLVSSIILQQQNDAGQAGSQH